MNLDCYLRHSAEQYPKSPTYWVFANLKFGIDYMPSPLQLWALDPAPKSLLTFSGIFDVSMDLYHCLSSWHKANSFYNVYLFMQSMNMGISVFLSSLPFLLLGCLVNGGRWFHLTAFISFPEKTYLHSSTLIVVYILWMTSSTSSYLKRASYVLPSLCCLKALKISVISAIWIVRLKCSNRTSQFNIASELPHVLKNIIMPLNVPLNLTQSPSTLISTGIIQASFVGLSCDSYTAMAQRNQADTRIVTWHQVKHKDGLLLFIRAAFSTKRLWSWLELQPVTQIIMVTVTIRSQINSQYHLQWKLLRIHI